MQTRLTLLLFRRFGRQSSRIFRSNPGRQQSSTAVHLEVSHMLLDWKTVPIFAWGDLSYKRARTQDQRRASQTSERLACTLRVFPLARFERTLKLKTYAAVIFGTFSLIHELWSADFDPFFFQRSLSGGTTARLFGGSFRPDSETLTLYQTAAFGGHIQDQTPEISTLSQTCKVSNSFFN